MMYRTTEVILFWSYITPGVLFPFNRLQRRLCVTLKLTSFIMNTNSEKITKYIILITDVELLEVLLYHIKKKKNKNIRIVLQSISGLMPLAYLPACVVVLLNFCLSGERAQSVWATIIVDRLLLQIQLSSHPVLAAYYVINDVVDGPNGTSGGSM